MTPPTEPAIVTNSDDVLRSSDAGGRVARGSAIRGLGYVAGVGFGFATSVLLLRYLGVNDYGKYGAIAALLGLVLSITDGGMTTIGARELSITPAGAERERLASSLMTLRALSATLGVCVAVVFAFIFYGSTLGIGAALIGISVIFVSAQGMATVPLLAELRAAPIAIFDLIRQGLTLLGVFGLVVYGASLLPFFGIQIPVMLIMLVVTLIYVRRTFRLGFSRHRAHIGYLIRQTLPMSVAVVLNSLYLGAMVVLVSLLSDDTTTGIYAAPARVLEVLVFLASVMVSMAIPVLAVSGAEDRERFRSGLQLLFQSCLVVAGAITIGLVAAAPEIMTLIGGPAFAPSGSVLQIQALALIGIFANQALQFALVTLNAQRRLIYANAIALVTLLVGGFVLVPTLGSEGGALAVVVGEFVLCTALLVALRMTDRSTVPQLRFLLLFVLCALPAIGIMLIPINGWIVAVAASAVFVALALTLKVAPPAVVHAFTTKLRPRIQG